MTIMYENGKKLVIFDRFYQNTENDHPSYDTVSGQISSEHSVIAHANELSSAAAILLAIKRDMIETPDVIVTGGTLDGAQEYIQKPLIETETSSKVVMGIMGKKEKNVDTHRLLLPIVDEKGRVSLPKVYNTDSTNLDPRIQLGFQQGFRLQHSPGALSGFVIAHLTNELLGERGIKVIGNTSGFFDYNVPIDAYVSKHGNAQGTLSDEINKS